MDRKELESKAKKLDITFTDETSDEELEALIVDAEKKANDTNSNKDVKFWEEEAKKAFEARDTAKKDARKLKEKIQALEDQMKDSPSKEELVELKKNLKELKEFKAIADKRAEEEADKQRTDLERADATAFAVRNIRQRELPARYQRMPHQRSTAAGVQGDT